jgi:sec-independent protein translocase protein TatA
MNTLALLPNLAGPDMIIIFVIVLIMFGAKKLPEFAKGLGQAVREFSKAKENVNQELHNASHVVENSLYHPPIETQALPTATSTAPVDLSKPADAVVTAAPVHAVEAGATPAPAQAVPSATPIPEALKPHV